MAGALTLAVRHWRVIVGLLLLLAIAGVALMDAHHVRQRDAARAALGKERQAHRDTVANYQAAAAVAARRDADTLARVAAEQRAITERISDDYQVRLADSVARYERLRTSAAAFASGSVTADVSATREATCRAYAGTACDRIPATLKAAQDNTDQLLALIEWAERQGNVSVSVQEK